MEKETNSSCKLRLLGPLQIEQENNLKAPRFRSQRTQALLGYLVARQRPVSRDSLAALFWPDETTVNARANLRRELHNLNRVLPNCWQIDQTIVRFISSSETLVDIYEVNRLQTAAAFAMAMSWLGGEFLEGITLPHNPEFDVWLDGERERWRQQTEHILLQAADAFWAADEAILAQQTLVSLLQRFPWHEEAHRRLMLLLARQGRYTAAIRQFERCCEALLVELATVPTPATETLYQRIKVAAEQHLPPLPPVSAPFIGRQEELIALRQRLLNPACRLVTITGLGGMGKSRLALETARTYAQAESSIFLHGAVFVSLVGISPNDLANAIATAVNIHLHGKQPAEIQLLEQLQEREMLLLLDNYEHFLPDTILIEKILAKAPDITFLITSRTPLRLQEEWIFPIEGLPYPPNNLENRHVSTFAAVQLFINTAERTRPPFRLAQYQQSVVDICRLVEGLPLAILLAASQLEKVEPAEILSRIQHNFDSLQSPYRNLPLRQQNLRAVFEAAWSQLSKQEQSVFAVLSVFQSSFSSSAAQTVTGASPALLKKLADYALITLLDSAKHRFVCHELLRQFAEEQLEILGERQNARAAHLAYFIHFAEEFESQLNTANQLNWLQRLESDHANFTSAIEWALAIDQPESAGRLAGALSRFWEIRGHLQEGERSLNKILAAGSEISTGVMAKILKASGVLAFERGHYARARSQFAASLMAWRTSGDLEQTAELLNRLGHATQQEGDLNKAAALYQESQMLYQKLNHQRGVALALNRLGHVMQLRGDHARASALIENSLELRRQLNDRRGMASSLNALAEMARLHNRYEEAEHYYRECLEICQKLGDKRCVAGISHNLGHTMLRQGDSQNALKLFREALAQYQELRNNEGTALCLAGLAGVAARHEPDFAAQLFGAAEALLDLSQAKLSPTDRAAWELNLDILKSHLDTNNLQTEWNRGRLLPIAQLIHEALQKPGIGI